ncbi:MAG: DUF4291 domain-containing protein [bacterium]|nr:DUF4291 domain-containing protein [bacterium]
MTEPSAMPPYREIRALYSATTITVYQAYSPAIAAAALEAGKLVPPFRLNRMTWIKPSFLWIAYRSGWAAKPGQDRILAITITRAGFEWALAHSCLSHYQREVYGSEAAWTRQMDRSPIRIQWDPERDIDLQRLTHRSIQIGLAAEATARYVNQWTVAVADATDRMHRIRDHVEAGQPLVARRLLPHETPYPLRATLAARIGADP